MYGSSYQLNQSRPEGLRPRRCGQEVIHKLCRLSTSVPLDAVNRIPHLLRLGAYLSFKLKVFDPKPSPQHSKPLEYLWAQLRVLRVQRMRKADAGAAISISLYPGYWNPINYLGKCLFSNGCGEDVGNRLDERLSMVFSECRYRQLPRLRIMTIGAGFGATFHHFGLAVDRRCAERCLQEFLGGDTQYLGGWQNFRESDERNQE